ncbi:hypothetical protein AAA799D07_00349 [Marine Group I thaumarchaeote SCGC AAA799-D07]|nr:hypothetical protein AAA799D07_00349 [Marine Group I thaumarchaeote SCGC AAA799-D07]
MLNLSVAIPDSSLIDESSKEDKTRKVSIIARACAIFSVNQIFVYKDGNKNKNDSILLTTLLKYLETPQYFRKQLFPKMQLLKFVGVLHPLKIPNHVTTSNQKMLKIGDVRDALVVRYKGKKFLDIGINKLIPYFGKESVATRITVQIKAVNPKFLIKEISREQTKKYWGYKVKEKSNLFTLLSSWDGEIILTSKNGKTFTGSNIKKYNQLNKSILVVFGSPERGIDKILNENLKKIQNASTFNFFPNQATETVRLEEAILGTLSSLNILSQ